MRKIKPEDENYRKYHKGYCINKGYKLVLCKSHPFADRDGYVYEHRLIMEKYLGRTLLKTEVVHHINGNTLDNNIENLMLFSSKGVHAEYHRKLKGITNLRPKNYVYTDEHRRKISKSNMDKKKSKEFGKKVSEIIKERWRNGIYNNRKRKSKSK